MSELSDRISTQIDDMMDGLTGDEIVEIGVGLVARGVFRAAHQEGFAEAAGIAGSASSVTTTMHLDMLRKVESGEAP